MNDTPSPVIWRQHDLDALRAFAMLLGIALHVALSLSGYPWIVQDLRPNLLFAWLFAAIHGFRMPLFFLLSGYFTMMLWRRRGMNALLKQRFQRVFLPCMIGLVTIVPLLDRASTWSIQLAAKQDLARRTGRTSKASVVEAVRDRDLAGLGRQLEGGADPNQADLEFGVPPLSWAAMFGDVAIAERLIDGGANVNGADKDGYRALHSAAFLGHPSVMELLLRRGADPKATSGRGETARESTKADWNFTKFIAGQIRVPLRAEDEVKAGRAECRRMLARQLGEKEEPSAKPDGQDSPLERVRKGYAAFLMSDRFLIQWSPAGGPFHLFLTSTFHHLWFLWFLCWFMVAFATLAPLAGRMRIPRLPRWLVISPLRWLWLPPLTMIPQLLMGSLVPGFGPDTSAGVLPQPHLLLYYGIYFGFGALYFDSDDREGRLGRWWWLAIPLAVLMAFPWACSRSICSPYSRG